MKDCNPTSRLKRSLVMIDSVSINIYAAEQSKSEKCDHFTIREYVSDSRAKNRSHCCPFSVDCNDPSSKDISPVHIINVPKFRRWQCQQCLSEMDSEGALEDNINTTDNCNRRLKTKGYRYQGSLENVVIYLSKKSERHLKPVHTQCRGTKHEPKFRRKQLVNSGFLEHEVHSAAKDFISKQHMRKESKHKHQLVISSLVDEHQEQWLKSSPTASAKVDMSDDAEHSRQHVDGMKLVPNHHNCRDSGGAGRRKTKKVRLLDDLFAKDKNDDQLAVIRAFHANTAAKVSCSALNQKRNKKGHEQDGQRSKMHNADRKGEMTKAKDINSTFEHEEMYTASKNEGSDAITVQAQKMLLGSNQGADVQKKNHNRGQKQSMDLCMKQVSMSTCQPFHGRAIDPQQSSITPTSLFKGKSKYTLEKVHHNVNAPTPPDCSKDYRISMPKNPPIGKVLIGHQFQSPKDDHLSKSHYHISDRCLERRKGTRYNVTHAENGKLRNEFAIQNTGESSSVYKSVIDKNSWERTNSDSGIKRPNQGSCIGNKKQKYSARSEGPTVVHHTELLFGASNKSVVGSQESPKHNKNTIQQGRNSEDIPMEIVELLARNQYERRLHEVGDKYKPQWGSNSKHDMVGNTTVPSSVVSVTAQNLKSNLLSLPNSWITAENGSGISDKKPNSSMMQRAFSSGYCPILPRQTDSSIGFPSFSVGSCKPDLLWNHKYEMNNFPPQHRVSTKSQAIHEEWQPPRQRDKTAYAYAWSMIPPNNPVHMLNACHGSGLHQSDVRKVLTGSSYVVEGQGLSNLSLAGFQHTTNLFGSEGSNASLPNQVNSRSQMTVSQATYSNETLTAMHLLSLMDVGKQSSALANSNGKTFDSSSNNHKLKQPSPYGYEGNVSHSDASFKSAHPVPRFGSVGMSLPVDVGNKKGISSHQHELINLNRTAAGFPFADEKSVYKSQKSLACGVGIAGQELKPAHEISKHISAPVWSGSSSSHEYLNRNASGCCNMTLPGSYNTPTRLAETGACNINRNPMDFTTPGPGNEYMIGVEELKLRNRIHNPFNSGPTATNKLKQNRFTLYTTPSNKL